mgnify:CR=1 FL=1
MTSANKTIATLVFVFLTGVFFAQVTSEKLKKEQEKLEQKINDTKLLLNKLTTNAESSLNELRIIENQVSFREELVRNFDNQVRGAQATIIDRQRQIHDLNKRIATMKKQYKALVLYAYKNRNKYGKLMYIFSSDNYYEAVNRKKYLDKIGELQEKQFFIIRQNEKLINEEIEEIGRTKEEKLAILNEKKKEKNAILKDKEKKKSVYQGFKSQEKEIRRQLIKDEKERENLKAKIAEAIRREIAEAERKRKERARRLAEAKAKENAAKAQKETDLALAATKELNLVSQNFEANRGRLPWPVEKGSITESYGRNPHPTLDNVFTNNNGIDVSAPKNAEVRSVFDGEVTSVLNIPGAGKVVIIKHGDYRTVYSNLQDSYVSVGMKVKTKQAIGSLLLKPGNSLSVVHFEIHQVSGSSVKSLNPASWVTL